MSRQHAYRPGAVGALLDIYEQAIAGLKKTLEEIPDADLVVKTDPQTSDENCRSLQTILTHVVHSGYGYATSIHNLKEPKHLRRDKIPRFSIREYQDDLTGVFVYTEKIFEKIKDHELEEFDHSFKIKSGWNQYYDIEQMMEHAIVHIFRHKRQIEKIKAALK